MENKKTVRLRRVPSERHLPPGLPEVLYHHGRPYGIGGFGSGTGSKCLGDETPPSDHLATPTGMYLLYRGDRFIRAQTRDAAGEQAEAAKEETRKVLRQLSTDDRGVATYQATRLYCCVGGKSALQITEEAAAGAQSDHRLRATALPPVACKRRT